MLCHCLVSGIRSRTNAYGSWTTSQKSLIMKVNPLFLPGGSCNSARQASSCVLSSSPPPGAGSLRAKFELSNGPSNPSTLAVQFMNEGSTLSGVDMELQGSGYRLSLNKKRFATGNHPHKRHQFMHWSLYSPRIQNPNCSAPPGRYMADCWGDPPLSWRLYRGFLNLPTHPEHSQAFFCFVLPRRRESHYIKAALSTEHC